MPLEGKLPRHVGIIMDGNGRWAKAKKLPRFMGHYAGVKAVEKVVRAAKDWGIPYLSLYAFSSENWRRPQGEIMGLMSLFRYFIRTKVHQLQREGARLRFAGRLNELPEDIQKCALEAERLTQENHLLQLIVCLNYGGRQEILDGIDRLLRERKQGPISEAEFHSYLYLPDVPDPDLIIRTSGEMRLSNFWLWQSSYSEYYFTEVFWPDFGPKEFEAALKDYAGRERRYGSI